MENIKFIIILITCSLIALAEYPDVKSGAQQLICDAANKPVFDTCFIASDY